MLSVPVLLVFVAIYLWFIYGRRPTTGFLADFAKLLDRPEFVDGFANRVIRRSFLKGEFRGRKIVVLLQQHNKGRYSQKLVVSMETHANVTVETFQFGGQRTDRETELALFDLETKDEIRLRHEDGCLKAMWSPTSWSAYPFFDFPGPCDPVKWTSILEKMDTVAASLERRAA
jgi:hypothetical protein